MSLDEKLDDVTQLWSPEEDGLYVGSPPKCSRRRWRILERRLVMTTTTTQQQQTTKTKWFRSDGSLAVLPDPLRPYLIRNIIPNDSSTVQFRPVYLPVFEISSVNNFYNSNSNSNLIAEWEIHRKSTRNDDQSIGRASSLSSTHFHQRN